MVRVALVKGENRRKNNLEALNLIKKDVKINGNVLIKPNLVSVKRQLAASHVDHLRGILDFLELIGYKKKIKIAEAAACGDAFRGYKKFGYLALEDEYNAELVDLNDDELVDFNIKDHDGKDFTIKLCKSLTDKNNFVISAAKLKTHDCVVATMSVKNIVMGSMPNYHSRLLDLLHGKAVRNLYKLFSRKDLTSDAGGNSKIKEFLTRKAYKIKMHRGYKWMNWNLSLVGKKVWPDLASIDGFNGMEGNGPAHGTYVKHKVAIASVDALAADRVCLELMGIDADKVGYLNHCYKGKLGEYDLKKIKIVGDDLKKLKKKYKLHDFVEKQYEWKF